MENQPTQMEEATGPKPEVNKQLPNNFFLISGVAVALVLGGFFGTVLYQISTEEQDQTEIQQDVVEEKSTETQDVAEDEQAEEVTEPTNVVVDTNQSDCFNSSSKITCGSSFTGQDAEYSGNQPKYIDNGDGTVFDVVTGLMWTKTPGEKQQYSEAVSHVDTTRTGGHDDWRIPSIKELYSLMDFNGTDPMVESNNTSGLTPFIDDSVFDFEYGDTSSGERIIDSQWVTSTVYVADVMNGQECFFGVNFADGRIKCYPTQSRGSGYYAIYVRGEAYGVNAFVDNNDGTVTDLSTNLMWHTSDSAEGMNWEDALNYCESSTTAKFVDWRLPNAKELQYVVDYSRSPDATSSPALDPIFETTEITNEANQDDYPFFWTGTTHIRSDESGSNAVYVSFGRALGFMNDKWIDVHGAGAQRSDPKAGNISDYPSYFGPQGDVSRLHNYVRCVRDVK